MSNLSTILENLNSIQQQAILDLLVSVQEHDILHPNRQDWLGARLSCSRLAKLNGYSIRILLFNVLWIGYWLFQVLQNQDLLIYGRLLAPLLKKKSNGVSMSAPNRHYSTMREKSRNDNYSSFEIL